jgi:hypothetical protein
MKAPANKQPAKDLVRQEQHGNRVRSPFTLSQVRSPSISPLSTGQPLLQRQCACGGGCPRCKDDLTLQTKLKISEPGDQYEQEADRIADQVMRSPEPTIQHQMEPNKEKERMVQREAISNSITSLQSHSTDQDQPSEVPPIVDEVLKSTGQPLDKEPRTFMEHQFGYDFGRVRVHADPKGNESAQTLHANAFTVGDHLVFDAGRYAPSTHTGRTLLAHELTHVVQQSSGNSSSLQRDDVKPVARIDVAIVLGDDEISMTEARSYASTVLRVTSGEDAKKKLVALGKPIGTIYVVSHSNRSGEVQVESEIGTISHIKLSDFSKDLKGLPADKAPTDIDFRGCKLGEAPEQMEAFRKNTGAKSARATNCWSIVATVTPLTVSGAALTDESQIPKGQEADVDKALKNQINGLKSDNGQSVKNCLIGLARGETADQNFAKLKRIYFQNKGNLTAGWASPEFNNDWQKGSICVKDMTATSEPCKIVTTAAPTAPAGSTSPKGAMLEEPSENQYAGDPLDQREGDVVV